MHVKKFDLKNFLTPGPGLVFPSGCLLVPGTRNIRVVTRLCPNYWAAHVCMGPLMGDYQISVHWFPCSWNFCAC